MLLLYYVIQSKSEGLTHHCVILQRLKKSYTPRANDFCLYQLLAKWVINVLMNH